MLINLGKIDFNNLTSLGYAEKMEEEYQKHMQEVKKANEEFDKKYNLDDIRL